MENQSTIICDTNIFIEFYKNSREITDELRVIGENNIALSVITASELFFGAINKNELTQIRKSLSLLKIVHLSPSISKLHLELMSEYTLSHNLTIPDAIIAATAIDLEMPLYTLNKKDFRFIPSLKLYK